MILTRTYLNVRRRGARKLLGSPEAMHAAVMSGFPPGINAGRPLWRIDADDPLKPTLYILSRERIDLTHLVEQAGWPTSPQVQSASYRPLLDGLASGQEWAFRLRANPTHRATLDGRKRIVAHVTVAQQTSWLLTRAGSIGVSFGSEDEPTFTVAHRESLSFRRGSDTVSLGVSQFDGVLRVEDPDALRIALTGGIGRAKAYGCGLMTLAQR